jgi:CRISPR type I-E-associated protein CasB/Cse2
MSKEKTDYEVLAEVCTAWWRGLQSLHEESGKPKGPPGNPLPPNRGALAQLRRIGVAPVGGQDAVDVTGALGVPAFLDLLKRLNGARFRERSKIQSWLIPDKRFPENFKLEPFCIAAATIARVREDSSGVEHRCGATAKLLGEGFPETQVFAEPRFKRLMRCRDDWPDLMAQARRIAAILEKKAPIGDLAASLVLWNYQPSIRRDWAFQYYQKSFEAPDASPVIGPTAAPSTPTTA